jgi:hypothetical protein
MIGRTDDFLEADRVIERAARHVVCVKAADQANHTGMMGVGVLPPCDCTARCRLEGALRGGVDPLDIRPCQAGPGEAEQWWRRGHPGRRAASGRSACAGRRRGGIPRGLAAPPVAAVAQW